MYSRILVPLDGSDLSEHVLPYVIALAQSLNSPVELLRMPENSPLYAGGEFAALPGAYEFFSETERIEESKKYLDNIADSLQADPLQKEGLKVSTVVRSGSPAQNIVDEAITTENTLVAMASHGRSGIVRWIMGSVADEVLRKSSSHLLLVRPPVDGETLADTTVNRIIMPVDGSQLAEQALAHVIGVAKALGVTVHLVRVTPSASEYYRQAALHPSEGSSIQYVSPYEEVSKELDAEAQVYLEKTKAELEQNGLSMVETHLVQGNPAGVISDMARSDPGSMLVIATHGRSGIGRWVLGSVADSVVRHSGSPVLLIRAREDSRKA